MVHAYVILHNTYAGMPHELNGFVGQNKIPSVLFVG